MSQAFFFCKSRDLRIDVIAHENSPFLKEKEGQVQNQSLSLETTHLFWIWFICLMGDYRMEQLTFMVYGINLFLIFAMLFILWTYATGKYRLVGSEVDHRLVKKRKLSIITPSLIVVLTFGISFVNVIAAFSVLVLMLVYSFVAYRIARIAV